MKNIIGQHLIIGISGTQLTSEEKAFIINNNIGGIILFSRNFQSLEQIHKLCSEIQSLSTQMIDKAPLFIGIDMEGGRVHRLKAPFTQWPSLKSVGDLNSPSATFNFALNMGTELRAAGINLDFAPCVDVLTNPENKVIGDRSAGTNPDLVSKIASAVVRGYIKSEILPCPKHFPGHGNTLIDSHEDLPIEKDLTLESLTNHLEPFKKSFKARCDLVMTAHVKYSQIDSEWPATLSEKIIQDLLVRELRFRGLVVTDDLDMGALTKHYDKKEIPVRALEAGANLLLYCNDPASPTIALEAIEKAISSGRLKKENLIASHKKILDLKRKKIINPIPKTLSEAKEIVGCATHKALAEAIAKGDVPKSLLSSAENE